MCSCQANALIGLLDLLKSNLLHRNVPVLILFNFTTSQLSRPVYYQDQSTIKTSLLSRPVYYQDQSTIKTIYRSVTSFRQGTILHKRSSHACFVKRS